LLDPWSFIVTSPNLSELLVNVVAYSGLDPATVSEV